MNGKKAKALRKQAKAIAQELGFSEKNNYKTKEYTSYQLVLGSDGLPTRVEIKKVTGFLHNCVRMIYQQLKKESR